MIKLLFKKLLDLLIPPVCPICGESVWDTSTLCPKCFASLHFITDPCCKVCGRPFPFDTLGDSVCGKCLADPPIFHQACAVLAYDDSSKKLILPFKHGDRLDLTKLLVKLMAGRGAELIQSADILMPVPLHRLRLLKRKYNQAAVMADRLAQSFHKTYLPDGLKRIRKTPKQGKFSPEQRKRNVANAFRINSAYDVKDRCILLIDDVLTTGATANECAKVLLKAGAKRVDLLTLAAVIRK